MKVVLFCGGLGLRMREGGDRIPKPMVPLGNRPLIWHVMKYYAHYGHTDFILCLGHKAEVIKEYFLSYNEAYSNDFVLTGDGKVELLNSDIHSWRITFVNTGTKALVGERLMAVRHLLQDDEHFLANYADGLTDAPLGPPDAYWQAGPTGSLALLPYDAVRTAADPRETLLDFLESAYRGGAERAGWDLAALRSSWAPAPGA